VCCFFRPEFRVSTNPNALWRLQRTPLNRVEDDREVLKRREKEIARSRWPERCPIGPAQQQIWDRPPTNRHTMVAAVIDVAEGMGEACVSYYREIWICQVMVCKLFEAVGVIDLKVIDERNVHR